MTGDAPTIEVRCDLDPASASAERERILDLLNAHEDAPLSVSLQAGGATQPSLQIFFATLKEAQRRGVPVSIGQGPDPATVAGLSLPGEHFGR